MVYRASVFVAATQPRPVLIYATDEPWISLQRTLDEVQIFVWQRQWQAGNEGLLFRACSISRLDVVLATGVDVPRGNVIWVSDLEKALEYGEGDEYKILMAYRTGAMERPFREVSADIPDAQRAELLRSYPTVIESKDGRKLWFSRLATEDPRLASGYEVAYAWWIPGDPLDALEFVVVFGRDVDKTVQLVVSVALSRGWDRKDDGMGAAMALAHAVAGNQ